MTHRQEIPSLSGTVVQTISDHQQHSMEASMAANKFRREEKKRLEMDIVLRKKITCADKAEELAIRIQDVIEQIRFELQDDLDFPRDDYSDKDREDWRMRAQRALAKMELVLTQVLRRRDLLLKIESHG
jgi:hypothetical protein